MRWIFFTLLVVNVLVLGYMQLAERHLPVVEGGRLDPSQSKQDSLVLLDELKSGRESIETIRLKKKTVIVNNGLVKVESDSIPTSRSLCTLVGSFPDQSKADYFIRRLAALGVEANVKNLLVSTTVGYWLHLPPLSSRKELLRRLSELQRQGVDSYVIPDGDLANGISLGMFSEEYRAKSLESSIAKLGYQPKIVEVPREKRELWVFLLQGESAKISEESWSELLSGKELLQKQQNLCSDVASA